MKKNWEVSPFLELVRIPNAFTAIADCLAGYFIVSSNLNPPVLACLVSGCLYSGGIVFNDYFDYEIDKKERPERVLPSGRISKKLLLFLV